MHALSGSCLLLLLHSNTTFITFFWYEVRVEMGAREKTRVLMLFFFLFLAVIYTVRGVPRSTVCPRRPRSRPRRPPPDSCNSRRPRRRSSTRVIRGKGRPRPNMLTTFLPLRSRNDNFFEERYLRLVCKVQRRKMPVKKMTFFPWKVFS